ncbi:hypothetical protein BGW38_006538, partial [Lunasporangiospora selenospora]
DFESMLRTMRVDLAKHMEEETVDLVELEQALSAKETADMAKEFHLSKKLVPTRRYPSAPNESPFEGVQKNGIPSERIKG